MESILEVKDLQKNYGDFAAVKGITFDIKEGEILLGEGLPRHPLAPDATIVPDTCAALRARRSAGERSGVGGQVCVAPCKG